ncbi:glycosyl transferase, group 1 [Magnetococcus marinus MC-1]|uniref:Glycosyl transferase, group 1 n=1 Tax=Magnetococcus marinus (strain ATCC BAA-1437 / JCM 17883 / MC-1) TaxID=156889 RepID=A0LAD8_MAGMM|nr:glycosyltransferase family 4 protein [Magnetococcus marinus]ABK44931.1 glycosyl transferase, group 1 [Magnetococcus marinus MC-1]
MPILALLTDAYGAHGGIAQYNRDLLDALAVAYPQTRITLLLRNRQQPLGEMPPTIDLQETSLAGKAAYFRQALHSARRGGPYRLILCGHINLLPLAQLLGSLTGTPVMLLCYGIEVWQPTGGRLTRWALSKLEAAVSISQTTTDRFLQWASLAPAKTHLLPNAIHLNHYRVDHKPSYLIERYALHHKTVIMTMGRLVSQDRAKGFDEVMQALPALLKQGHDVVYLIVGDGPDRQRLSQTAQALGLADRVRFTGYIDEKEKADHYLLADCYAMPSQGEGFGFVLLEAMACGIPSIGSQTDGTREALRDGLLGTLVDPHQPAQLITAIERAIEQPRQRPEALNYFAFNAFTQRVDDLFAPWLAPPT